MATGYIALAAVSLFWGTTYLGIRISLESFPPLYLMAIRYTISGGLLLLGAVLAKVEFPPRRELQRTALIGIIAIGLGNGCLMFAELWIPSGLAALFVTTSPFWMLAMDALLPGGEPLHRPAIGGMLIGFTGVALLVAPDLLKHSFSGNIVSGFLLLQLGCAGWCFASILQKRTKATAHSIVSGAIQQLATGIFFFLPAMLFHPPLSQPTPKALMGLIYLVLFGSIVGYSAYIMALERLPVAIFSIYCYVNPVVAVFLGWLFYREPFGVQELIAMLAIFAGIAVVTWTTNRQKAAITKNQVEV